MPDLAPCPAREPEEAYFSDATVEALLAFAPDAFEDEAA